MESPPPSSDAVITSQEATGQNKTLRNDNRETSNNCHDSAFPLLPLPPREYRTYGDAPTEDKMGTLHNAIIDTKQQLESGPSSSRMSSLTDKGTDHRVTPKQLAAVKFVPRTTQLESRKRRMQEKAEHSETDAASEPLIGPRLPEEPKLDMDDESLNTTVNLIRNTLKNVRCLSSSFFYLDMIVIVTFPLSVKWMCFIFSGGSCYRLQTSGKKSETTSSNLNVNFRLALFINYIFLFFLFTKIFFSTNDNAFY